MEMYKSPSVRAPLPHSGTYIPVLGSSYLPWSRRPSRGKGALTLFLLYFLSSFAFALTPADEIRYSALTKEIRCVVCQNQNIADSNAPLANDLRKKIYAMVNENKSDNDIKEYLVARYGEFILFKPRFNSATFILWLFPFFSLLILTYCFYRFFTRKS